MCTDHNEKLIQNEDRIFKYALNQQALECDKNVLQDLFALVTANKEKNMYLPNVNIIKNLGLDTFIDIILASNSKTLKLPSIQQVQKDLESVLAYYLYKYKGMSYADIAKVLDKYRPRRIKWMVNYVEVNVEEIIRRLEDGERNS